MVVRHDTQHSSVTRKIRWLSLFRFWCGVVVVVVVVVPCVVSVVSVVVVVVVPCVFLPQQRPNVVSYGCYGYGYGCDCCCDCDCCCGCYKIVVLVGLVMAAIVLLDQAMMPPLIDDIPPLMICLLLSSFLQNDDDDHDHDDDDKNDGHDGHSSGGGGGGGDVGDGSSSSTTRYKSVPRIWFDGKTISIPVGLHKPWYYQPNELLVSDELDEECPLLRYIFEEEQSRYQTDDERHELWSGVGH
mmetsp:Transcript_29653/g.42068  ORF Transcript_29653/g.42068 Transcript_29653/m.42068 type:complete len:242 (-) Transcript_29653:129-854(-)